MTEKRWREVFLLSTGMMRKADDLLCLMKRNIDFLLEGDEYLQHLLDWIHKQSLNFEIQDKKTIIRAFIFCFLLRSNLDFGNPYLSLSFIFAGDIIWEGKKGIYQYIFENFDNHVGGFENSISL